MKINFKNSSVLWTGGLTAVLQYVVSSNHGNNQSWSAIVTAVLTVLVAIHGALTSSIFEKNDTAQNYAKLVSEGEAYIEKIDPAAINVVSNPPTSTNGEK